MIFYRKLSLIERTYIVNEPTNNYPFAVQMICEGVGNLSRTAWITAFDQVLKVNPIISVQRVGRLKFSALFSVRPDYDHVIQEHGLVQWNAMNGDNADFLEVPMDVSKAQGFQILLIQGTHDQPNARFIIFRIHHALSDVGGLMIIMRNFFAALNNQSLLAENSLIKDEDVLFQHKVSMPFYRKNAGSVAGSSAIGSSLKWRWVRKKVDGKFDQLLILVLNAIQKANPLLGMAEANLRFRVTFDLRKYLPKDTVSTCNLTNAFDIDVPVSASLHDLKLSIMAAFRARLPLQRIPKWLCFIAGFIPENWLAIKEPTMLKTHLSGKYYRTGTISVLSKEIDLKMLSGGGFECHSLFGIPGPYRILSCFIGVMQMPDHIELMIGMPELLTANHRLEKFTDAIATVLGAGEEGGSKLR